MGKKKGATSWLSAVKRAFRSPTKDNSCDKKAKIEHQLDEDEEKVILHFFLLHRYAVYQNI